MQQLAQRHKDLLAELETIRSGDPKVKYLKEQARAAIVNGENDVADRFFGAGLCPAESHPRIPERRL